MTALLRRLLKLGGRLLAAPATTRPATSRPPADLVTRTRPGASYPSRSEKVSDPLRREGR